MNVGNYECNMKRLNVPSNFFQPVSMSVFGYRGLLNTSRRFVSTQTKDTTAQPSAIFRLVGEGDVAGAVKLCEEFAPSVNMAPVDFLSKQCSERSYLIYRLSSESRKHALEIAQSGEKFPDAIPAKDLIVRHDLWDEDVMEQYQRAVNCVRLSRTSLELGSPSPARDYQIIGKSMVWRLLFGRTACVLQTYLSRTLQQSRLPHDFAIANHRKAARLFDEHLAPPGPSGPLEEPDKTHDENLFKTFSEDRIKATHEHMRLVTHLTSDVARYLVAKSSEGRDLLQSAETIISEEFSDLPEIPKYAKSVFKSTSRSL